MPKKLLFRYFFEIFLISFIILYVVAASSVSLNRYWQFNAFWYELGLFDSVIYKVSNFQLPIVEQFGNKLIFADHFNPSLFLYSPIYWIFKSTEALLIAQAATVGLSAWVGYVIGKKFIKDKLVLFALVFAYLMYVGLQNALFTDFHDTTVATLFVILTFWSIFNKKWLLYWIFLIISLGFKENMAGFGVGLGLFLILQGERNVKVGLATILFSILYYLAATKVIIPYFSGGYFGYNPTYVSNNHWDILKSFFVPIELKTKTMVMTLLTFGFAPLFTPAIFPILIEHFVERFVMTQHTTRWDLGFHYNAILSPILFVSSVLFISRMVKKNLIAVRIWAILLILVVLFLHRFYLHGTLLLAHHPVFYEDTKKAQFMRDFFEAIPKDRGLIMTQNNIAAHLGHYRVRLLDTNNLEKISPDVVALDMREGQNINDFFPVDFITARKIYDYFIESPSYEHTTLTKDQHIFVKKKN